MYILDFDDCIFDTESFKSFLFQIQGKEKQDKLKNNYFFVKSKKGYFDFDERKSLSGVNNKQIKKIRSKMPEFVYKDFFDFVESKKEKIFILTFGDKNFQKEKLENSNVRKYINNYFVTEQKSKKKKIVELYQFFFEEIVYIDNKFFVSSEEFDFKINLLKIDRKSGSGDIKSLKELL